MKQVIPQTIAVEFRVEEFKLLTALLGKATHTQEVFAYKDMFDEDIPLKAKEVTTLFDEMQEIANKY